MGQKRKYHKGFNNRNSKKDERPINSIDGPRIPSRQYVILFGVNGSPFSGMQKQPGDIFTIEGHFESVLREIDWIDSKYVTPADLKWSRAARTDKGVSALLNVVSLRLKQQQKSHDATIPDNTQQDENLNNTEKNAENEQNEDMMYSPEVFLNRSDYIEFLTLKLNEKFTNQIFQIYDIVRCSNRFNAREFCDRRRYEYIIPSCIFSDFDSEQNNDYDDIIYKNMQPIIDSSIDKDVISSTIRQTTKALSLNKSPQNVQSLLSTIVSSFVGTHNFHNYTEKLQATDPSSKRYILSVNVDYSNDIDSYVITFYGQSFLLHQIRKMSAMCIFILNSYLNNPNSVTLEDWCNYIQNITLSRDHFIKIPKAPAIGLLLAELDFTIYNKRIEEDVNLHLKVAPLENFYDKYKAITTFKNKIYQDLFKNSMNKIISEFKEFIIIESHKIQYTKY